MVGRLATEGSSAPRRGTRRQRRVGSNPGGSAPTYRSVSSTCREAGTPPPWLPRTTRIPSRAASPSCRASQSTTTPRWLHTCTYLPRSKTAAAARAAPTGAPTAAAAAGQAAAAMARTGSLPGRTRSGALQSWGAVTPRRIALRCCIGCRCTRAAGCTTSRRRTRVEDPPCTARPRASAAAGRAPAAWRARSAGGRAATTAAAALILLRRHRRRPGSWCSRSPRHANTRRRPSKAPTGCPRRRCSWCTARRTERAAMRVAMMGESESGRRARPGGGAALQRACHP